jgi:hypothetical protein
MADASMGAHAGENRLRWFDFDQFPGFNKNERFGI